MKDGTFRNFKNPYDKWQGSHWVLAAIAELGYPEGDKSLLKAKDQVLDYWLAPSFFVEFEAKTKGEAYRSAGVPLMRGRHRRCASQQGYALWYLLKLGLEDRRIAQLAERLMHWQWPDGGWNCDKNPSADSSSLIHTAIALRGLSLYAKLRMDPIAEKCATRAAEVLLKRKIYKRRSNGKPIHKEFMELHYPLYWHYDFLGALKILAECGHIHDPRCQDALDLLESRQLKEGGWPATKKYYTVSKTCRLNGDFVDWGPTRKGVLNEWITADALYVLKQAGRLSTVT